MFSLRRLIKNYDETGSLNARMRVYVEKLMADPEWHAKQDRLRAEKQARQRAHQESVAERERRKLNSKGQRMERGQMSGKRNKSVKAWYSSRR
jgi:hypothetical protein